VGREWRLISWISSLGKTIGARLLTGFFSAVQGIIVVSLPSAAVDMQESAFPIGLTSGSKSRNG
jgi:hypothetical protein